MKIFELANFRIANWVVVAMALFGSVAFAEEEAPKPAEAPKAEAKPAEAPKTEAKAAEVPKVGIQTKLFTLNHASAVEVANKFNQMWNGEFGQVWKVTKMAVAFEESNTLMITAPEPILEACEKTLKELDVEAPQVYIEARFVELGNTASHKVGIDWSMLGGMKGSVGLGGGIQDYHVGKGVSDFTRNYSSSADGTTTFTVNGTEGSDGNIQYFRGTLDFSDMYLVLKALDATEDTKTFSNPKIIVSSGKKAMVDMTTKYPNVTISAKRTSAGDSTSLDLSMNMAEIPGEDKFMFAKEAFFSWGIELEVTPRISTNGLINVSIVPTISSQTDWVTSGASDTTTDDANAGSYSSKYPVIDVKRLITEFNMKSGQTAVIGGLSKTEEVQVDNGIPILRDIWWIGPRLFGGMERQKVQKEIIVFVTVGLVNPREMKPDAGLPKNAVLGRQYTKGQKLEPGDRPEKSMEGIESLDMRPLEEQAKDPLKKQHPASSGFDINNYIPFTKDPDYQR